MYRYVVSLTRPPVLHCILLVGTLFSVPACKSPDPENAPSSSARSIVGDWELSRFDEELLVLPESVRRPNLLINPDGAVYGLSGVNQYRSTLSFDGMQQGAFVMGPIAATRMAGPSEAMDIENRFLESLQNTRNYRVDGDTLVLIGADGDLLHLVWLDPS